MEIARLRLAGSGRVLEGDRVKQAGTCMVILDESEARQPKQVGAALARSLAKGQRRN